MTVALVAIDGATGAFDKLYSYIVPDALKDVAAIGSRVTVPFGMGNRIRQGMIFGLKEEAIDRKYKEISTVTDKTPVLNDEAIKLCEYMQATVFCTYFDAVHALLPVGLNLKLKDFYDFNDEFCAFAALSERENEIAEYLKANGETSKEKLVARFLADDDILLSLTEKQAILHNTQTVRRAGDLTKRWIRTKVNEIPNDVKLTARQREIAELVLMSGSVSVKEVVYFTGVSASVIKSLEQKGIVEIFDKQEFRIPFKSSLAKKDEINLTAEQQKAFSGLLLDATSGEAKTSLLYGVTGSGKTQVFLKLVDEVSNSGRGVIIMVPEIALTPQMIKIFSDRYGEKIAVFHSGLSLGQRMDEYTRIKTGRAQIAIGTRSAVFAPFEKLGLIVIDEEQEHTYKSEKTPRFHAKNIARFRASYHKCLLCLSSATPSVETFAAAQSGSYGLYTIKNRYGDAALPQVSVVDMKKELLDGNSSSVSRFLAQKIEEGLEKNKQSIILLNRRGHNTYVSCRACGHVFSCSDCSISLTYHSANKRLMCHYCGKSEPLPTKCPECGENSLSFSGVGTQKLEEELRLLFPSARILRLDADSTVSRDAYTEKLTAFANGEYDIMIGTQMVAKGLDFKDVTLVGVIGADRALYSDDYRGFERIFSLLTQVIGRAGRSGDEGLAVIQTVEPDSNVIELAKSQNYDDFYAEEILNRKLMIFPPFCDLCMIYTSSADASLALDGIKQIYENIKASINGDYREVKIIILGPLPASVPRVNGKYRYRILIKCKNTKQFREMIKTAVSIKHVRDLSVGIDINPETVL